LRSIGADNRVILPFTLCAHYYFQLRRECVQDADFIRARHAAVTPYIGTEDDSEFALDTAFGHEGDLPDSLSI